MINEFATGFFSPWSLLSPRMRSRRSGTTSPGVQRSFLFACALVILSPFAVLASGVTTYPVPNGYEKQSRLYTVTVNDVPVPVLVNTRADGPLHYARMAFDGAANLVVTVSGEVKKVVAHPASGVRNWRRSGNKISFGLDGPQYVVIEFEGLDPLCIIADRNETSVPDLSDPRVMDVARGKTVANDGTIATRSIQALIDRLSSEGGGTLYFGPGLYRTGMLTLKSNVSIYLHGGAVLLAADDITDFPPIGQGTRKDKPATSRSLIYALGADNVHIYGRGVIDANGDGTSFKGILSALCLIHCQGIKIEGVTLVNGRGWTTIGFSRNVEVRRFKSLQPMLHATADALDFCNCRDVLVDHCLLASGDDSFCVKACSTHDGMASTWGYRPVDGRVEPAQHIILRNSTLFSNAAGIKIGIQGYGDIRDVICEDLDIVRGRALNISHTQGAGIFDGITFRNIRFTAVASEMNYRAPTCPIDFIITAEKGKTAPSGGVVRNVLVQDVTFGTAGKTRSRILGEGAYYFSGIRFQNVSIAGERVDGDPEKIDINEAVQGLVFGDTVNGVQSREGLMPHDLQFAERRASHDTKSPESRTPHDLQLFLLVGQSNMAGRAPIQPEDREPIPGVWMLDAQSHWVPASDPVHFDKPSVAGVGPARSFAETLLKMYPGIQIGLIPCAVGGTSLEKWRVNGPLFDSAVARTRSALSAGSLRGILWHQGESDISKAGSYAERCSSVLNGLRHELDADSVPVIVGAIGEFLYASPGKKGANARELNRQIESLANVPGRIAVVLSTGLSDRGDGLHFSHEAQMELGRRYAEAFQHIDLSR